MQIPHRPGPLHQVNKTHGRKASSKKNVPAKTSHKISKKLTRQQRLLQLRQVRSVKKDQANQIKKSVGALNKAPLVVGWLDQVGNSYASLKDGLKAFKITNINDRSMYVESSHFRCKVINLDPKDLFQSLDIVKRLDILIIVHRPQLLDFDDQLVRTIRLHCLPTTLHLVLGQSNDVIQAKKYLKTEYKDEKIVTVTNKEFSQVFQSMGNCKRVISKFRESRPVIETDKVEVVDNNCLAFTGYVRHKRLSPNQLVHIANYDDYQIAKIEVLPDLGGSVVETLFPDPMKQETLDQENDLDPMEGEQTWPTAEELAAEAERLNTRKVIKKLPRGTSKYQEAWIPDDDDHQVDTIHGDDDEEVDDEDDDDMQDDEDMDDASNASDQEDADEGEEEDDDCEMEDEEIVPYGEMEAKMDHDQVKQEIQFPDEIDTPTDQLARVRFARYRGLKSFRTSPWDPQENLPPDYAKIFQFKNFQQTKKVILNEVPEIGVDPGLYVRVYLKDVPVEYVEKIQNLTPNLVGLLKHERKMTIMNYVLKALPEVENPIRSKEELFFIAGHRKFTAKPIYSNHSIASKFKQEKFLYSDRAMIATLFAPVTFPAAPVLAYRRKGDKFELVATGSVLDSNPKRMIIKRIRLSGHPFKIHSKSAVIRLMFFNHEDVVYFKPVELVTRYNRRGHITEPLGTHGHMKCIFDKKIRSDDCVFMNLYKRVFPKCTYSAVYDL